MRILIWNSDINRGSVRRDVEDMGLALKPLLTFPFDIIFYEPTQTIKYLDGFEYILTPEEIIEIEDFITAYDFSNKEVPVINEYTNLFIGFKPRTEIVLGEKEVSMPPPGPNFRWVPADDMYEEIFGLDIEGHFIAEVVDPTALREIWNYSQVVENQPPNETYYVWDFVNWGWIDTRSLDVIKVTVKDRVRVKYDHIRAEQWGKYIPHYEMETWRFQEDEAREWQADNLIQTPMLDAIVGGRTDGITKATLVDEILLNSNNFRTMMGAILADEFNELKKIADCLTLDELDLMIKTLEIF